MDSYQPIYDAVRSRISGCDVGEAVDHAIRQSFDISIQMAGLTQDFAVAAYEMSRPSVLFKPALSIDGDHWCALYGENIQEGVAGFGKSPKEAMENFDKSWWEVIK